MKTEHTNGIADNITGKGLEFFSARGGLMACKNLTITPLNNLQTKALRRFAFGNKQRRNAYRQMAGESEAQQLEKCVWCMFSRLDGTADIDPNGKISPEVVECPERGRCKWEGIACLPQWGAKLSPAQKRVAQIAHLPAKIIADRLCIAERTAVNHLQAIKARLNVKSKAELVKILTD